MYAIKIKFKEGYSFLREETVMNYYQLQTTLKEKGFEKSDDIWTASISDMIDTQFYYFNFNANGNSDSTPSEVIETLGEIAQTEDFKLLQDGIKNIQLFSIQKGLTIYGTE